MVLFPHFTPMLAHCMVNHAFSGGIPPANTKSINTKVKIVSDAGNFGQVLTFKEPVRNFLTHLEE